MKKILKKTLVFVLIISIFFIAFQNFCEASEYSSQMKNLITKDYNDSTNSVDKVNGLIATIITSIRIVGVAVAVTMLLVLAMKYMSAAPGDKADIKKSLITYVIGAVIFFGVIQILEIINNLAKVFNKE